MFIHAWVWGAGEGLGIKGVKVMAADKFRLILSQFALYGAEVGFTFSFFEDFVRDVEAVRNQIPRSNRILCGRLSMHIQSNIKEWTDEKGAQACFIESSYRLIFRGIQAPTLDLEPVLQVIREKCQDYLDAETGPAALEKDSGALALNNTETGDAASEGESEFDDAEVEQA